MKKGRQVENYQELKARQQKEMDNFDGIFFAFNQNQFKEGMEKIGLLVSDRKKICRLGNTGGYILKEKSEAFRSMMRRHFEEQAQRKKDEKFLLEALTYELNNHEFCITHDPTEALEALGIDRKNLDPKILTKACRLSIGS